MHHQDDTGAGTRAQRHRIRFGAVSLFVQPWRHPSGRGYWRFSYTALDGRRRTVTRATLREARVAAQAVARELHGASVEVSSLPVATLQRLARLLAADPALERCEGLLAADGGLAARLTVAEACERFLAAKQANRGAWWRS